MKAAEAAFTARSSRLTVCFQDTYGRMRAVALVRVEPGVRPEHQGDDDRANEDRAADEAGEGGTHVGAVRV